MTRGRSWRTCTWSSSSSRTPSAPRGVGHVAARQLQAHLKLADVLYSLDDMPLARKYYAQSLELNDTSNPRAALGMVMCTASINAKGKNKSDAANSKLYQIARLILLEHTVAGSPESSAFKALLNA